MSNSIQSHEVPMKFPLRSLQIPSISHQLLPRRLTIQKKPRPSPPQRSGAARARRPRAAWAAWSASFQRRRGTQRMQRWEMSHGDFIGVLPGDFLGLHGDYSAGCWFGCHFLFSHILGIIIPIDFHIFQRGSNHQPGFDRDFMLMYWRLRKSWLIGDFMGFWWYFMVILMGF